MQDELWAASRSGSHAGRGFHYQDAVGTELAIRAWRGELPLRRIVPEGLEDLSLELDTHWLHLQAKSRRDQRGQFTLPGLKRAWQNLAARLAADPAAHCGLVLERALVGVSETGLGRTLSRSAPDDLKEAVGNAVAGIIDPDDFLARTHLLVMPSPEDTAIGMLAERFELPPACCVAHHAILRRRLAHLADENGVRPPGYPAALTIGDTERLFDEVSEAIDPSLLEQAVRDGIAELADFRHPGR